jgi:putative ABC transport system permease protein
MNWFWKRPNRELEEEIEAHLAMAKRDRMERGERPESAERSARREFGNRALVEETTREMWGWRWLERFGQDLRYAARCMRRTPGFTAVAVGSLALGIGANTAIFSLIDALMLRWLPVREPQHLLQIKKTGGFDTLSYPVVRLLAEQTDILSAVAGFSGWIFPVGPAGAIRNVPGAVVTGGYYETLGLNPVAGRLLTPDDDQPGAPLVAVITDAYWDRQYARNPSVVGETIRVNGRAVTVVGISPPGFTGARVGAVADITMAVATVPAIKPEAAGLPGPGNDWLLTLVRLREGVSLPQASARLSAGWPGVWERAIDPSWPADRKKSIREARFEFKPGGTGWTYLREIFRKPLLALMALVALVLLIACANVANLLLARSAMRQKEIAVRLAIGAGRRRIIRQLLTESLLLSAMGAGAGIALAGVSSRALVNTISNQNLRLTFDLSPNWHVLGFTAAVGIATGLLFGLAPAFQTTAVGPSSMLKEGSRRASRLLPSLVTVQVAFSLILLVAAGLFVRTLRNLENLDPGFRREGVLLVDLEGRRSTGARELIEAARQAPGAVSASISTHTPLSGSTWSEPVALPGEPLPARDNAIFAGAGPAFFETMRIPVLAGRVFSEQDAGDIPTVALVNEELVRRILGGRPAVGQHLTAQVRGHRAEMEIVGVVRNTALRGLRGAPYPAVYVPYYQLKAEIPSTLEVRAAGSLGQAASALQKAIQAKLPESSIEVRTLSGQVEAAIVQERMMAVLAGTFGALALLLSCVGLYGLLNYRVARRTREIGIRMALGAQRSEVIGREVLSAAGLVAAGMASGLPAVWVASKWVKSMLFGLAPTDPATIAGAAVLLTAAALTAAFIPARRASNVDPTTALRHE